MFIFNKKIQIALLATFALLLASCGGSSDSENPLTGPPNFGDCTQNPNEGISKSLSSFNHNLVDSGYFNKALAQNQLDSLLNASSNSIVSVLRQQGVQVYQIIEDPMASCQYFSFLDSPTEEAKQSWKGQSPQSGSSVLLGLFTTYFYRHPSNGEAWLGEPTILLRHDTQKWTLLHEMTHYLFAKGRTSEPYMPFDGDLINDLNAKLREIKSLESQWKQNPSDGIAIALVEKLKEYHQIDHRLDARQELEEFTIESMLVERSHSSLITSIDKEYNIRNAYSYMKSNSNNVRTRYRRFAQKLVETKKSFEGIASENTYHRLSTLLNNVHSKVAFIDKKLSSVFRLGNQLEPLAGLPMGERFVANPTAPHSHVNQDIVKKQNQLFEKLF